MTVIIGIDPGLVDTGVVVIRIEGTKVSVEPEVIHTIEYKTQDGTLVPNYEQVAGAAQMIVALNPGAHVFIEAYRPRGNTYGTDAKMRDLMAAFRKVLPKAAVIDNTGVKQVVREPLMRRLGIWTFKEKTHHQDLRSAARIGIYGALKDTGLNQELFDFVSYELNLRGRK